MAAKAASAAPKLCPKVRHSKRGMMTDMVSGRTGLRDATAHAI